MNDIKHNWKTSLIASHEQSNLPCWRKVYKSTFPTMTDMVSNLEFNEYQRKGVDRLIKLANGTILTFDEKYRKKDYGDILLEEYGDFEHDLKGWIQKDLICDYIAYMVEPASLCYFLPTNELQHVWQVSSSLWKQDLTIKKHVVNNGTFTSINWSISTAALFSAVSGSISCSYDSPSIGLERLNQLCNIFTK